MFRFILLGLTVKQVPGHVIDRRGRWKYPRTKYIYAKNSDRDLENNVLKYA